MSIVLKFISFVGLALTVGPAFLVFAGTLTWSQHATLMTIGTVLWFATAPFWMRSDDRAT